MRRRNGNDLTRNEQRVLAAALQLRFDGVAQLYGYELFGQLCEWEQSEPMNHGTLYRCLRSLEKRGAFFSQREIADDRLRVMYTLTPQGVIDARRAAIQLVAAEPTIAWIDPGLLNQIPAQLEPER